MELQTPRSPDNCGHVQIKRACKVLKATHNSVHYTASINMVFHCPQPAGRGIGEWRLMVFSQSRGLGGEVDGGTVLARCISYIRASTCLGRIHVPSLRIQDAVVELSHFCLLLCLFA